MFSGVRFTEHHSSSDDVATLARLSVPGESEGGAATVMPFHTCDRLPGERFSYSSAETQVLGLMLRAAPAPPLAEYLSAKIWQPMDAEADASWAIDRGGYEAAYFAVDATVRDYARLGMLLANDGALDGPIPGAPGFTSSRWPTVQRLEVRAGSRCCIDPRAGWRAARRVLVCHNTRIGYAL